VVYLAFLRWISQVRLFIIKDHQQLAQFLKLAQQWYSFGDVGPEPSGRLNMVSVGPKIFVLGGETSTKMEDHESIHILDTVRTFFVTALNFLTSVICSVPEICEFK